MNKLINLTLAALVFAGVTSADLFDNAKLITIVDGNTKGTGWYDDDQVNYKIDDHEVEVGCQTGQNWDLEGFYIEGSKLTMVGGYDFANGYDGTTSGDLFIDIDGSYGDPSILKDNKNGNVEVESSFGYEYVIKFDFTDVDKVTYSVIDLRGVTTATTTVYYDLNINSNPWNLASGGAVLENAGGNADYKTELSDVATGFTGGKHNALSVDLSFLGDGAEFTSHFTMSCGNDNLMGSGTVSVPEPGTLSLLSMGGFWLIGLYFNRKRKNIK